MKGQKIRQWKRGKDVHRESGAQRISGFGDFQIGQDKTLVPEEAKACSTEIWGCDPAFCLVPCFHNTDFYHHTDSVIKVFAKLHIPQYYISLLVSMRFSSVSPLISFSITCIKKLSSVPSRNLLDCLCSAAWPFQQISWWLKSTMRSRACEHEASASCLNKVSFTFFFFVL